MNTEKELIEDRGNNSQQIKHTSKGIYENGKDFGIPCKYKRL